ncbi:hypothetical protein H6P81_004717 [Aristolochia fimbriata]|uniref:Methyltransferase type 12 domain-containing protein n=1 Tax=Aristolochia fimbriata TaxID=158543 RepID=A0AAV7ESZ0_ARIFI|nr:hypothetical protein H6P81_004717 [Aristolochia fimbriata]
MAEGQRFQIYAPSSSRVSAYWKEKYERDAKKYWDIFYKRHQDKFFKDRHYLDKEWGHYFADESVKVVLEVGCGAGNTIFPLIATYPDIFIHACDFSPRAIALVKSHKEFREDKVNAFTCDLTVDDLVEKIPPSSVDIVTMVFVLSAISPEKMPLVLQNIRKVLKPNGHLMVRDYATGDLAQERLTCKDQEISENFYVRGDGTRAFYFSEDFMTKLFQASGFSVNEMGLCCKQVENRAREIVMNRRWIQAVFSHDNQKSSASPNPKKAMEPYTQGCIGPLMRKADTKETSNGVEIDISEGIAIDMFGLSQSTNELMEINLKNSSFKIKALPKEFQHTCKSTGLMLWESARLMSILLAENPSIVSKKTVLELGCGSAGVCSMLAVQSAALVVATDGDPKAIELLNENVSLNLELMLVERLVTKRLEWGNGEHIESIKELNPKGFEVIIGTDVTYVAEAIYPLFQTARALISGGASGVGQPALILCHVVRRVDEVSILSAASHFGFRLVDRWSSGASNSNLLDGSVKAEGCNGIISSWFSSTDYYDGKRYLELNSALNILYFEV